MERRNTKINRAPASYQPSIHQTTKETASRRPADSAAPTSNNEVVTTLSRKAEKTILELPVMIDNRISQLESLIRNGQSTATQQPTSSINNGEQEEKHEDLTQSQTTLQLKYKRSQNRLREQRRLYADRSDELHAANERIKALQADLDTSKQQNETLLEELKQYKPASGRQLVCIRCSDLGINCSGDRPGCKRCESKRRLACQYAICRNYRITKTCRPTCGKVHDEVGYRIKDGLLSGDTGEE